MAENEKQVAQTEQTEPTEKKQETEEEKREREKEEAECLNRQINYFIMRHMWQVVRGRKHEDGDTICICKMKVDTHKSVGVYLFS